jgi:hypothetical protein
MTQAGRGGKQARRQKRGLWIGFFAILFSALVLAGLAIWILAADPSDIEGGGRAAVLAILGVMAAALGGLGWYLFRKARPAVARHLRVDLAAEAVRRGQPFQATLTVVRAPRPGDEIEVALVCTERYDIEQRVHNPNGADYDQRVTKTAEIHREEAPIEPGEGPRILRFTVPADGPFSYEGDCLSAVWSITAVEKRPRRSDRRLDAPVWVTP